jgi:hypothetical protein
MLGLERTQEARVAGFTDPNIGRPRMEEEEEPGFGVGFSPVQPLSRARSVARDTEVEEAAPALTEQHVEMISQLSAQLLAERNKILDDEKLGPKQKLKLLEANRRLILNIGGGTVAKTENVVYGLIVFASVTTIILAALTTFADLPSEVALAFISTVAGGLIATVAQKIRRL